MNTPWMHCGHGFDIQHRRDWKHETNWEGPWRVRTHSTKGYGWTAYASTYDEVLKLLEVKPCTSPE